MEREHGQITMRSIYETHYFYTKNSKKMNKDSQWQNVMYIGFLRNDVPLTKQ